MKAKSLEELEATWASVEHWLDNCLDPDNASAEGEDCALCKYSIDEYDDTDCHNCPIYRKTGYIECGRTPWHDAFMCIRDGDNVDITPIVHEYEFLVELAIELSEGVES